MSDQFIAALPLVALIALLLLAIACERYIRRHPRNRYTRKDRRWPTEGQTHRSYWSSCKRVEVE